jgi:hypothetical protein
LGGADDAVNATAHIVCLSGALLAALTAQAQGDFQNLDFESADLSNPSGIDNAVPIANALPDWSGSIGGVAITQIWANVESAGQATIDVLGPGWSTVNPGILDGNYTVLLQAFNAAQGNVSLWQSGMVPAYAQSLQFEAYIVPSPNEMFSVSFAGNSLSPVVLSSGQTSSGQDFDVYGVDMASYAGHSGQLEFTSYGGDGPDFIEIDDITFSPMAVPEPSMLALTALGGLLLGAGRWFARR